MDSLILKYVLTLAMFTLVTMSSVIWALKDTPILAIVAAIIFGSFFALYLFTTLYYVAKLHNQCPCNLKHKENLS